MLKAIGNPNQGESSQKRESNQAGKWGRRKEVFLRTYEACSMFLTASRSSTRTVG
jgi:hypothetical protein